MPNDEELESKQDEASRSAGAQAAERTIAEQPDGDSPVSGGAGVQTDEPADTAKLLQQELSLDVPEDGQRSPALPYPVVAVGASAGGIQAFSTLLDNLPGQTGMAIVLVTHLAPDQKSYLAEIMKPHGDACAGH